VEWTFFVHNKLNNAKFMVSLSRGCFEAQRPFLLGSERFARYAATDQTRTKGCSMDITFTCPNCKQQLEAPTSLSGSSINCPACGHQLVIPEADPVTVRTVPLDGNAARLEEKHFVVPVTESPTQSLIQKPLPPLDVAARQDGQKQMRVKCIRHSDCVEVGKDRFDEIVTDVLNRIGEGNVINVSTFNYEHLDLATRQMVTDYGIMIVYRG
jgi:DNA-directed RNA polymerase subunit RPC12/RpoP